MSMITVWGGQTSRSIRIVWLLEEMGLEYRVRQVDMLADDRDAAFLAVNPADYFAQEQVPVIGAGIDKTFCSKTDEPSTDVWGFGPAWRKRRVSTASAAFAPSGVVGPPNGAAASSRAFAKK